LTMLGIQMLIGLRLGSAATGQFVLAMSILTLPVSLVAMASAPVIFHRLARAADTEPAGLTAMTCKVMLVYVSFGALLMSPIMLMGPGIFTLVFGEKWEPAGAAAAVLCMPQIFAFSLTVTLAMFRVTRRIHGWFIFELVGTTISLGGLALLPEPRDLTGAAWQVASLGLLYQLVMHVGCLWATSPVRIKGATC
jgi:O-antigen/teichoic acid export membrane protein